MIFMKRSSLTMNEHKIMKFLALFKTFFVPVTHLFAEQTFVK